MRTIKVALLGLGTVGGGTYDILMNMNKDIITDNAGCHIEVTKVLDLDESKTGEYHLAEGVFTKNADDVFEDPEIDIVVEMLGGIEPSTSFMLRAMKSGKHVVTSNKAAVAANFDELMKTAKECGVLFRMEASVGGGIPVLNAITGVLGANEFVEILGILNGTTNYILTQMEENALAYDEALKDAQAKGFAEADPTADVEGIDVANKLSIMMALAFGKYVSPNDIPTQGITKITMDDIEKAKAKGQKIKLIANASNENGTLKYSVAPMMLPNDHPLAGVKNEFNAVFVKGNAVDDLMFYGKGAGALPTGSAIAGDVLEIAKRISG